MEIVINDQVAELSREELLRRYAKKSPDAPTDATRRSPFKFLDSYDASDADIFFGRDYEIDELLGHFHGYGHVLIYGESGCGKTSLVQCGLRSRIPEADALFIPLRVHATGLSTVCHQIRESASLGLGEPVEVSPQPGLVDTLREVRQAASRLAELTDEGQVASMLGARADRIVPSGSQWKWLHRSDGVDPATDDSDFHSTFFTATYDDSQWQIGRDSSGPTGGFGYGDPVGVPFETPAEKLRKTAWFRHKFTTARAYQKLAISMQRDDGVIMYLDGVEVGRDNVEDAAEAFDLLATRTVELQEETEVQFFQLAGSARSARAHSGDFTSQSLSGQQ